MEKLKAKWASLTNFSKILIVGLFVGLLMTVTYYAAPGLRVEVSKQLTGLEINTDNINNVTKGAKLPLPSQSVSSEVSSDKLIRIAGYAWNGNQGLISAIGGPRTTEGSLMEASGVNLEFVRVDGVSDLRNMLIKFTEELDKGTQYPKSDKSAFAVSIMGDGVPYFISTTQKSLDEKFGKNKYHVQAFGAYGLSDGEDKLIGPKIWKENPQSMRGCVISSVIGDGDWVIAVNYASINKIPVNPDPTTYDANAINFYPSENDDYINSVKELIKSQKSGFTVPLKEVVDGKLTGKTLNRKIDGATTWTPGDKIAFDALTGFTDVISTKEFTNQMATTLVGIKEWAVLHDKEVINILKNAYTAGNQIKQYDEWAVKASEAIAKTFNYETPKYWYDLFKGQKGSKDGLEYNVGGTKVLNYADALQYYGITDGTDRYKAVYEQVSKYLVDLNPMDYNGSVPTGPVAYDDAVNLYFLKSITGVDAGKTTKVDYSATKTKVMGSGHWNINFANASTQIQGSDKDLEEIYNLLVQAETSKLSIVGHTDNVGGKQNNVQLSKGRANSVVEYLVNRGLPRNRFQLVDGRGDSEPIADNGSASGKAKNRRVDITLLQ
jgi:OOP family OmpA-OmpF porin